VPAYARIARLQPDTPVHPIDQLDLTRLTIHLDLPTGRPGLGAHQKARPRRGNRLVALMPARA